MPARLSTRRRFATAARWPVGVAFTSWRYMWRTTPLHRTEEAGDAARDAPPPLASGGEAVQDEAGGAGPLFHRRYRTRIRDCDLEPAELLGKVADHPDFVAPSEFASFQKTLGEDGALAVGDEFVVRMPGPWDGPIRVIDRTPESFRFATLDGHLEAGQIEFRARREGSLLVFEIESWGRSAGRMVHLLYDRMRMAKETQLHMWISTLEGVVRMTGGRMTGGIDIHTRRVEG